MSTSLFLLNLEEMPVIQKLNHLWMCFQDFITNGGESGKDFINFLFPNFCSSEEALDSLLVSPGWYGFVSPLPFPPS